MLLKGKNAVITGSSRGIGKAMLEVFAQNGANVLACARTQNKEFENYCKELENKYEIKIIPIYFDLSDENQIKEGAIEIRNLKLPIDVLVNNAGISYNSLFQMTSIGKLQEVFNVNFYSQFLFSQYIVKLMIRKKSGSIINVSSTSAIEPDEGRSAYSASKASIIATSKIMAAELGGNGIRVNVIAPGISDTEMVANHMPENTINETINKTMLKRMGKPHEIANVALFLASDLSSYITGQILRVDGGLK